MAKPICNAAMLQTIDQLMQSLGSALGPHAVTADGDSLDTHRIDGVTPRLVVTPSSVEQVAATLRLCTKAQAAVIPWGGGTALALGNPPRRADVVIKLHKLDRVVEHDAANLTVSAQCGATLNDLQAAIAAQKQLVPIDAPLPERATIGGIVAANLNGPRRACYGGVRDLVIGMKILLADGAQIKAGGKVVKNVAGYDMCKLFVGSLGTLGIIIEVTLRVAPIAERTATLVGAGDLTQLENLHEQLLRSALAPAAVSLVRHGAPEKWRLGVCCEGFDESVERQLGEIGAMATRSGINCEILTAETHNDFWSPLRDFPLQPERLIFRVTVPRAKVFDFVKLADGWQSTAIVGDTAMGTIWIACAAQKSGRERFSRLTAAARERHGHAIVFAAPFALKTGVNVWGASAPTLSLMREIKHRFDPDALLNPGRFVGNL
jgi:glycolate oxidase FAD binding subunit